MDKSKTIPMDRSKAMRHIYVPQQQLENGTFSIPYCRCSGGIAPILKMTNAQKSNKVKE